MNPAVKGNLKSRTNWLAIITAIVGYLQMPDTQKTIARLLNGGAVDPETIEFVLASLTMCCGLCAIVLRNMTTTSVIEKGQ